MNTDAHGSERVTKCVEAVWASLDLRVRVEIDGSSDFEALVEAYTDRLKRDGGDERMPPPDHVRTFNVPGDRTRSPEMVSLADAEADALIARVEHDLGIGKRAWILVPGRKLARAFAAALSPATPRDLENWADQVGDEFRDAMIERFLDHLFTNGCGQRADRLKLERRTGWDQRDDLGGWGRPAARKLLRQAIDGTLPPINPQSAIQNPQSQGEGE